MMQIVYFSQKEQFLLDMDGHAGEKIYVTPSPVKADALRSRLSSKSFQDVITIAKFTSRLVESLWPEGEKPQVKRKSELLLIFGILKNKYLPDLGFEPFIQAYNLFSDLRSFTLDLDALSSVLEEEASEICDAVSLFWKLLELTGYLDEHGAYQKIAEALRSAEEIPELKKTYVFWGFQHLNGQQVDLLKALAIRYDVIIPFPLALKEKLKRSDWLSWLREFKVEEKELPLIISSPRATWISVNSREMAMHLKPILRDQDQVVLGVSKLSPLHLDIVPSLSVSYKIPHELLTEELKEVYKKIKDQFRTNLTLNELKLIILSDKHNSLKVLKAKQLYLEALKSISDLTDENIIIDVFFLKLLSDVVALNQPRTSYVPASPKNLTIELKDMSSLEFLDRRRRVLLCVDERFEDIQSLGQNYTESIQKALGSLGPLKRNELELLFKHWEFRDLFTQADVFVLMNEGTLKHSLIWKRLFSEIVLTRPDHEVVALNNKTVIDAFERIPKNGFQGSFSASKFQTFADCPRKFYFSYIEKIFPMILLQKDFDVMTSGTIIHSIIENYFKDGGDLKQVTMAAMDAHIKEKKLIIPKEIYLQRSLMFYHRAYNGIQFVQNIELKLQDKIQWKIEQDFETNNDYKMVGRIDCLGVGNQYVFLLDFKSSKSSASTSTEVAELESLQLWAYTEASYNLVKDIGNKKIIIGYVVLDDPGESNLLTDCEEVGAILKQDKFCKVHKLKESFQEVSGKSRLKMKELSFAINTEKIFPATPRKKSTCHFCELNSVCVKSELPDV